MKITDGLLGEHALFYSLFDSLETVVEQAPTAVEIQRAFDAVRDGVLTHASIEDELLLSDLGTGPAVVMRAEHHEIETLATAISRARTVEEAREVAGRLIDLLRDHFHKEEQVLFPMCESVFGEQKLEALGEKYRARRGLP